MRRLHRGLPRWLRLLLGAALALAAIAAFAAVLAWVVLVDDSETVDTRPANAFYEAPTPLPKGPAGKLVRTQRASVPASMKAPLGATATKVLYLSSDWRTNSPNVVSGVVYAPPGRAPRGGRPIIAWAHGTSGVASGCAPSLVAAPAPATQPGFGSFLRRGWVVVATDYPGLGTRGPHPYLNGISEGRAVLDSVRAARQVDGVNASRRVVVWGHSQGGQSALFAGQLAKSYSPDLNLLGVAAAAPAVELSELLELDAGEVPGAVLGSFALWSWSHTIPQASLSAVVDPSSQDLIDSVASRCIVGNRNLLEDLPAAEVEEARNSIKPARVLSDSVWARAFAANRPTAAGSGPPLLIAQGTADTIIRPQTTAAFERRLCAAGRTVESVQLRGVEHPLAGLVAAPKVEAWAASLFAGRPSPGNCPNH